MHIKFLREFQSCETAVLFINPVFSTFLRNKIIEKLNGRRWQWGGWSRKKRI